MGLKFAGNSKGDPSSAKIMILMVTALSELGDIEAGRRRRHR